MKASLRFDVRAPAKIGAPAHELYAAAIDMSEWADQAGFDHVQLTEHHAVDDGYNPSPIVLAAAIASRTHRIRIRLGLLVIPLYDPLKTAEDLAVLDLITAGRLDVGLGAGYRVAEYEMFGRDFSERPTLVEEAVDVFKKAWTGEPFEYRGRTVRVTPRPFQRPRPPVFLGGTSNAAARRAARIADAFYPTLQQFDAAYFEERKHLGLEGGRIERRAGPIFVYVAADPEKAWERIGVNALHENDSYYQWQKERKRGHFAPVKSVAELRTTGNYVVVTPDECVQLAHDIAKQGGTHLQLNPLVGGLNPALGWECLDLFAAEVLPRIQDIPTVPVDQPV